ncbi:MAG: hypothetical protein OEW18_08645, partial [Candidatus Aminicenantes bacterium]|nr:hypothetical protein [Candidatus Aminicenantes bacterium]
MGLRPFFIGRNSGLFDIGRVQTAGGIVRLTIFTKGAEAGANRDSRLFLDLPFGNTLGRLLGVFLLLFLEEIL